MHVFLGSKPVVDSHGTEPDQNNDLESHTCNDGVVSSIKQLLVRRSSSGCDTASDSLDDEAGEISRQEDDGIPPRLQP